MIPDACYQCPQNQTFMWNIERVFSGVFLLAAVYNVVWGTVTVSFPNLLLVQAGLEPLNHPFVMSAVGMLVAVYGYGFWVVSKDLKSYPQLIVIATIGKTLGTLGTLLYVARGMLNPALVQMIFFNDFVWLPFFYWYLVWVKKEVKMEAVEVQ